MATFIIMGYVLKSLIIVASILGYLSAKARIPQMKELFLKKADLSRKMWLLVVGLPVLYIALGEVTLYLPIPFNPTIPMIILWIIGMFFGTKTILGSDIQDSKISLGKFVTIYTIATIIFTFAVSFIGGRILTRIMFGL